jgi:hypothetical protein
LYQSLLRDVSFYELLYRMDVDLASEVRAAGCECGGALHRGDYRRKPRGGPSDLGKEAATLRLSTCCSREGCRRRKTPPSLRFLGRKVFFGVVVLLVPVLREGPTPARLDRLAEELQVSVRTIRRWQRWWREVFGRSPALDRIQGLCSEPIDRESLPWSLLLVFRGVADAGDRVLAVLRAVSGQAR